MEQIENEKQNIVNYTLDEQHGYTRILVQLFGSTGHGKSSLINSFIYSLQGGKFQTAAQVNVDEGQESFGGLTTVRTSHQLTNSITVVDNRGFGKMDNYETGEIYAQLANILQLDEVVAFDQNTFLKTVTKVVCAEMNCTDLIVPLYVYRYGSHCGSHKKEFRWIQKRRGKFQIHWHGVHYWGRKLHSSRLRENPGEGQTVSYNPTEGLGSREFPYSKWKRL
ncbi:hypothetical protein XELAEV_18047926mg [Xenopus laevis]|uniref:Uncharacterized protein n=1 Tax=Xenopus laevis TaxID=8355 RepID=A0A974H2D5_XENLA|nr:hypothetical protein XELAEV_18047926mg [Xenopus laevis]